MTTDRICTLSQKIDIGELRQLLEQMHGQRTSPANKTGRLSAYLTRWIEGGDGEISHIYFDADVAHIFEFKTESSKVFDRHVHGNSIEILHVLSGRMIICRDHGEESYGPGDVAILYPGEAHSVAWDEPSVVRVLLYPPDSAYAPKGSEG